MPTRSRSIDCPTIVKEFSVSDSVPLDRLVADLAREAGMGDTDHRLTLARYVLSQQQGTIRAETGRLIAATYRGSASTIERLDLADTVAAIVTSDPWYLTPHRDGLIEWAVELSEPLPGADPVEAQGEALSRLGTRLKNQVGNGNAAAEPIFVQAREAFTDLDLHSQAAGIEEELGTIYVNTGRVVAAETAFIRAQETFTRLGLDCETASCDAKLGDLYQQNSRYADAEKAFTRARDTYLGLGMLEEAADADRSLGILHQQNGQPGQAEAAFLRARNAFVELDLDVKFDAVDYRIRLLRGAKPCKPRPHNEDAISALLHLHFQPSRWSGDYMAPTGTFGLYFLEKPSLDSFDALWCSSVQRTDVAYLDELAEDLEGNWVHQIGEADDYGRCDYFDTAQAAIACYEELDDEFTRWTNSEDNDVDDD